MILNPFISLIIFVACVAFAPVLLRLASNQGDQFDGPSFLLGAMTVGLAVCFSLGLIGIISWLLC